MSLTCKPMVIGHHPMPAHRLKFLDLPAMTAAFEDFRIAPPGAAIGLSLTVIQRENVVSATGPASILISQGAGERPIELSARDALKSPRLHAAMDLVIYAPSVIQDMEETRWTSYGWQHSGKDEYHMRELWIFPHAALLVDNIHECIMDLARDLPYLAPVMVEPATTKHALFSRTVYVNALMEMAATAAIPELVSEWPEDVPEGRIPFAPLSPPDLTRAFEDA